MIRGIEGITVGDSDNDIGGTLLFFEEFHMDILTVRSGELRGLQ